jgi:hypothetical protein
MPKLVEAPSDWSVDVSEGPKLEGRAEAQGGCVSGDRGFEVDARI